MPRNRHPTAFLASRLGWRSNRTCRTHLSRASRRFPRRGVMSRSLPSIDRIERKAHSSPPLSHSMIRTRSGIHSIPCSNVKHGELLEKNREMSRRVKKGVLRHHNQNVASSVLRYVMNPARERTTSPRHSIMQKAKMSCPRTRRDQSGRQANLRAFRLLHQPWRQRNRLSD